MQPGPTRKRMNSDYRRMSLHRIFRAGRILLRVIQYSIVAVLFSAALAAGCLAREGYQLTTVIPILEGDSRDFRCVFDGTHCSLTYAVLGTRKHGYSRRALELGPLGCLEFYSRNASTWYYRTLTLPSWGLVVLLSTYPIIFMSRRPRRAWYAARKESARRKRGLCLGCGYDLRGNTSGICPECGRRLRQDVSHGPR